MILDGRSVTALRTGAVAAVASEALAPAGARSVGIVGCGLHGASAGSLLVAAGLGAGVCYDVDERAAARLANGLGTGWRAGPRTAALEDATLSAA